MSEMTCVPTSALRRFVRVERFMLSSCLRTEERSSTNSVWFLMYVFPM